MPLIVAYLQRVGDILWFAHAGEPSSTYEVVPDAAVAWDDWNDSMLATWLPRSKALEEAAQQAIGDGGIDEVFRRVIEAAGGPIREGMQAYFDRRPANTPNSECNADLGLWPEILESVERDVAWAGIEALLDRPGFFTSLLEPYGEGRWPCSWSGVYPEGRFAVL